AAEGGRSQGVSDAQCAVSRLRAIGAPANTPVYFAVDEASAGIIGSVDSYFRGVDSVIGVKRDGAYGDDGCLRYLYKHHIASWFWQTPAWSGGADFAHRNLFQYNFLGNIDQDKAYSSYFGQFLYWSEFTNKGVDSDSHPHPSPFWLSQKLTMLTVPDKECYEHLA